MDGHDALSRRILDVALMNGQGPDVTADAVIALITDLLLSDNAIDAGAQAVWDTSPGDWPYERAKQDGSGFLTTRVQQQRDCTRVAIRAAIASIFS